MFVDYYVSRYSLMKKFLDKPKRKKKWIVDMFSLRVLFSMLFWYFHVNTQKKNIWERELRKFLSSFSILYYTHVLENGNTVSNSNAQKLSAMMSNLLNAASNHLKLYKEEYFFEISFSLKFLNYNVLRWNNYTREDHHQECFNH